MGLLDNFERGLERVVNGAFAKTFRSGLQPIEVSAALKRELDTKAVVVTRDRILVPNQFVVHLSPGDYERLNGIGPALIDDFVRVVTAHARDQEFQFAGAVSVQLVPDESLTDGLLHIVSANVQSEVRWAPVVDIAGKRYPLRVGSTVIGRGHDADITVDDTGISRKHLQITWDGSNAQAKDLGSTNGSQINGERIATIVLRPETLIQIGRTSVVYRIVPETASPAASASAPSRAPAQVDLPASEEPARAAPEPQPASQNADEPAPRPAPPAPAPAAAGDKASSSESPSDGAAAFWRDL